ncbi:hypothetical protein Ahy_B02g061561 isoform B [Arachis hypogaea]|uniref:Uncharacterized protein n=1 Tax=Arachis hypogaea TaxID=3818 RepID=A0A445AL95_ARAHY|nr:hypothetical protein Ahy_B02g061561 isoform B [Arachis hypogaea]
MTLDGAATDDIALGVAVGSKGKGNLHRATFNIQAILLLLLIAAEKKKSVLRYLFQQQGEELPANIAAGMNSVKG